MPAFGHWQHERNDNQTGEEAAMTTSLKSAKIAPKGMGLNDFVAHQEGYFAAEGLDVEFD